MEVCGAVCSCVHMSPTPPGRCSTEATGAETDPLLSVSVAQKTSAGCSPTAHRVPVDCHLRRSAWVLIMTDLLCAEHGVK